MLGFVPRPELQYEPGYRSCDVSKLRNVIPRTVKKHVLTNIYDAEEYVFANCASCHNSRSLHVHMSLGEAFDRAAIRTLSLCGRDIHRKYAAQLPRGSITVNIVKVWTHCRSPVGPKRSVLILSALWPQAVSRPARFSTNSVGPQT